MIKGMHFGAYPADILNVEGLSANAKLVFIVHYYYYNGMKTPTFEELAKKASLSVGELHAAIVELHDIKIKVEFAHD